MTRFQTGIVLLVAWFALCVAVVWFCIARDPQHRCYQRGYLTYVEYEGHLYCDNPIPAPPADAVRID